MTCVTEKQSPGSSPVSHALVAMVLAQVLDLDDEARAEALFAAALELELADEPLGALLIAVLNRLALFDRLLADPQQGRVLAASLGSDIAIV